LCHYHTAASSSFLAIIDLRNLVRCLLAVQIYLLIDWVSTVAHGRVVD
jgi:hypothetical protein